MKGNLIQSTYMYRDKPKQASIFTRKKASPTAATGLGRYHLTMTDFKLPTIQTPSKASRPSQPSQKHGKSSSVVIHQDRVRIDEKGGGDVATSEKTISAVKTAQKGQHPDLGSIDQSDYLYKDEMNLRPKDKPRHFFKVEIKAARRTAKDEKQANESGHSQERKVFANPEESLEYVGAEARTWNRSLLILDRKRTSSVTDESANTTTDEGGNYAYSNSKSRLSLYNAPFHNSPPRKKPSANVSLSDLSIHLLD